MVRQKADRPEPGKIYSLTGSRSIMAGDNWQASEVFCGSFETDHRKAQCTPEGRLDHEHGWNELQATHTKGKAAILGCTPLKCALQAEADALKAYKATHPGSPPMSHEDSGEGPHNFHDPNETTPDGICACGAEED